MRIFVQAFQADRFQVPIHGWIESVGTSRFLFADLPQRLHGRFRSEWRSTGKQLVENRAQAVNVRRGRQSFALTRRLFGRHVSGCAEDGGAHRQAGIVLRQLGQPEIGDVRFALLVEQDIGGLQIAMENAALVGVMHRPRDRRNQPSGLLGRSFDFGRSHLRLASASVPPSISFMLK